LKKLKTQTLILKCDFLACGNRYLSCVRGQEEEDRMLSAATTSWRLRAFRDFSFCFFKRVAAAAAAAACGG
jgi:hypothetical protein